jgi:hypothetical protein
LICATTSPAGGGGDAVSVGDGVELVEAVAEVDADGAGELVDAVAGFEVAAVAGVAARPGSSAPPLQAAARAARTEVSTMRLTSALARPSRPPQAAAAGADADTCGVVAPNSTRAVLNFRIASPDLIA